MKSGAIVLLGGPFWSTNIVYNHLRKKFEIGAVIVEARASRLHMILRRARRLGWQKTFGQACFRTLAMPALRIGSARRIREIKKVCDLDETPIPAHEVTRVRSVNDAQVAELINHLAPAAVVVNGTRIISSKLLNSLQSPLINVHAGITPLYRGVHGAYWALVQKEPHNCGVTVHLIDDGIDTGRILGQAAIDVSPRDNFATYHFLQLAAALPLLDSLLLKFLNGNKPVAMPPVGASRLWSHPTLFEYVSNRVMRGVK
jgi:folate-dependent phosphoribosylglycinamide formyltransferase PurN